VPIIDYCFQKHSYLVPLLVKKEHERLEGKGELEARSLRPGMAGSVADEAMLGNRNSDVDELSLDVTVLSSASRLRFRIASYPTTSTTYNSSSWFPVSRPQIQTPISRC
jgi:hypothetical protein